MKTETVAAKNDTGLSQEFGGHLTHSLQKLPILSIYISAFFSRGTARVSQTQYSTTDYSFLD